MREWTCFVRSAPLPQLLEWIAAQDTGIRRREGFSISTLGVCMAKQLFVLAGYPAEGKRPARMLLLWRLGLLIERELIALLQMSGETVVGLQKGYMAEEPPREGHIDGLILRDGKLYAFDIKSANKMSFEKWVKAAGFSPWQVMRAGEAAFDPRCIKVKSYRPVKKQYEAYYYQAQGYMDMIRSRSEYREFLIEHVAAVSPDLAAAARDGSVPVATDGFYFFVYCKDNSSLYEEFVPFDEKELNARLEYARKGFETIAKKKPTKTLARKIRTYREFSPEDGKLPWQCRRCEFMPTCWDELVTEEARDGEEDNGD